MGASILWTPGKMRSFCRKNHVHKIPRFRGGVFGFFFWGGGVPILFLWERGFFWAKAIKWPLTCTLALGEERVSVASVLGYLGSPSQGNEVVSGCCSEIPEMGHHVPRLAQGQGVEGTLASMVTAGFAKGAAICSGSMGSFEDRRSACWAALQSPAISLA